MDEARWKEFKEGLEEEIEKARKGLLLAESFDEMEEIVRAVLRKAMHPETSTIDPEDFRYVIADELGKVLSNLRVQSLAPASTTISNNGAEAKYGDKLDRMLGNLSKR